MLRKPVTWIVLVLLSLGAIVYSVAYFSEAFPIVNVDLQMNRTAALDSARARAQRFALGPDGFSQAASFQSDGLVQTFVELEGGGKDAFRRMIETERYQPYQWTVRHYAPDEARETEVRFTPDGVPYGFTEDWPEDAPGAALSADSARTLAEQQAPQHWDVDLSNYTFVTASRQERPSGRVDHTFVYQRPDLEIGEDGRYRLRLGVSGAELSEVEHFVRVPEAFERRYEQMRSANETISFGATIAVGLLYLLAGCIFGVFWLLRRNALKWRTALAWGGVVAGLQFLASLNQLPLAWMNYDTAVAPQTFLTQQILIAVAGAVGFGVVITLSFMAAEGLSRLAFGNHPSLWKAWNPRAASSKPILNQTMLGYLLVSIFVAYQVTLYFFTQDLLGWWNPSSPLFQPNILAHVAPWLAPIANSLQAGFWEECLFRAVPLAGAALIGDRLGGRRWWIGGALLVQAVIFGAAHANYAAQPAYARLVELILPSIGFGLLYLAFGLLPGIILHFAFDVVWMSLPLFVSEAPGAWMSQAMIVVLTLIPLGVVVYGRLRTGAWTELPERFYNRTWSPSEDTTSPEIAVPVLPGLSRQTALASAAAGVIGLGAWVGVTDFTTYEPALTASRAEAEQTAQDALRDAGATPNGWMMVSSVVTPNGQNDRFVWQEGGAEAYRQLMGSYLDGPLWQTRFITFEGSVEARAEEYRVHWAPAWGLSEVVHELPDAAPGDSLPEAEARALADSVIQARYNRSPDNLQRVGAEPTARPNRRDWTFTYADTSGYPLDQGQARIVVDLAGSEVTNASRTVHVPEAWEREARSRETATDIVGLIAGVLIALLALGGMAWGLVLWARGHFDLWTFVAVGGAFFVVWIASTANSWPTTMAGLDTAQPFFTQVLISVVGSLVAGVFGGGALGLYAGFLHARIGSNEPTPLGRSIMSGLGVGALGAGLFVLAGTVGPDLSPPWSSYSALSTAVPWLAPVFGRLITFAIATLGLLLGAVAFHRWTQGGETRRATASGAIVALGLIVSGVTGPASLGAWAAQGLALALFFGAALWGVLRYDRSMIPMMGAAFVGLPAVKAMITAAHPYAVPGQAIALVLVLGLGVVWTRVLHHRQTEAARHGEPTPAPAKG